MSKKVFLKVGLVAVLLMAGCGESWRERAEECAANANPAFVEGNQFKIETDCFGGLWAVFEYGPVRTSEAGSGAGVIDFDDSGVETDDPGVAIMQSTVDLVEGDESHFTSYFEAGMNCNAQTQDDPTLSFDIVSSGGEIARCGYWYDVALVFGKEFDCYAPSVGGGVTDEIVCAGRVTQPHES
ncbi:MAG: hypothetical protein A2289_18520 [Deltaproteobacteria bacterium RIFOXYA12_FULL_58_15]|nr:MAG: hypothetical protein A2289_18520 [Deltaproteobacteria bacterium RIFOXYA12_FULL_58_15]OGR10604.1 MAG: hypothetical protein A2341_09650 [Deltaproteobacteria bacterium RIFOXYB12_FULL_58_9]